MKSLTPILRTGAAMTLALGLAACGNIFGGSPAGQPAPAPAPAAAESGGAETGFWQDPKAPGAPAGRSGAAAAGDWDDDNDNDFDG
jgi:hypothetical protein